MELEWSTNGAGLFINYLDHETGTKRVPELTVYANDLFIVKGTTGWRVVRVVLDSIEPKHTDIVTPVIHTLDEAKQMFITLSHLEPEELR